MSVRPSSSEAIEAVMKASFAATRLAACDPPGIYEDPRGPVRFAAEPLRPILKRAAAVRLDHHDGATGTTHSAALLPTS